MDGDEWVPFSHVIKDPFHRSFMGEQSDLKKHLSWDNIY